MDLNDKQTRVVEAGLTSATNVVAGAGTGKTRVLAERYLRFVRDGIPPSRLLALTFTLKAAEEMRKRVFESVGGEQTELVRELYAAWIMNFHSFGYRVIREHAPALGIDPGVDVATIAELKQIDRVLERRFLAGRIEGVEPDFGGAIPPPAKLGSLFQLYLGVVKKCRGDMIPIDSLTDAITPEDVAPYIANVNAIKAVYEAYTEEMARRNLIDFSDMIARATRGLLDNPSLAQIYRDKFDHILVDEFQDTNTAQFHLLRVLSDNDFSRVTVVGDEKQSIYRWRDARVENIRDFPGEQLDLEINYRSRQNVLDLAHVFVCGDEDLAGRAIPLVADRKDSPKPVVLFHPEENSSGFRNNEHEAEALAAWVTHLTGGPPVSGVPALVGGRTGDGPLGYGDIAVLLRAVREHKVLPAIERAFCDAGIPYVVLGGADAAGTRTLEVLYSFLSLLLPGDRARDLLHVLENRPFDVGQASFMELFGNFDDNPADVFSLLSGERINKISDRAARERLDELVALLRDLERSHASAEFRDFMAGALEDTPFVLKLLRDGGGVEEADDLTAELMDICDVLDRKGELGLWVFLDHLRAALDERSFHKDEAAAAPPDHVRIMTIHQAKGLEFPAVAVSGIRPSRPDSSGFFVSKETGVYSSRWKEWGRDGKDLPEREVEKSKRKQEERCLLYVAMTRAKDYLFLSSPKPGGGKSLFADILEKAELSDIPRAVFREVPPTVIAGQPEKSDGAELDVASALSEWRLATKSLREQVLSPTVYAAPVYFLNRQSLDVYGRCPLQYRYHYILDSEVSESDAEETDPHRNGKNTPARAAISPAEFGSFVHELLRDLMEKKSRGESTPDGWMENMVAEAGIGEKARPEVIERATKLIEPFLVSDLATPGDDLKLEIPFQARLDRAVFSGTFDRVERFGDTWRIVDYKTGREKDEDRFQMEYYLWALHKITEADSIAGKLCYLNDSGVTVRDVDAPLTDIDSLARDLESSIMSGEYPATPGPSCQTCSWSDTCLYRQP